MNEVQTALVAFPAWMNRPVTRVQVFTWQHGNRAFVDCPRFRVLRPYRDAAMVAFRRRLAASLRRMRQRGKIQLPVYIEAKGDYQL